MFIFGGTYMKVQVRTGDTFWHYSRLFHLPLILMIDSNPIIQKPEQLEIGQVVHIPGFTAKPYTIRQGDTFWKIAQARNLDVDALLLLNQRLNPNRLEVGQRIRVPARVTKRIVNGKKPYDYESLTTDLNELFSIYPFIQKQEVGKSVLGLSLHDVRIGKAGKKVQMNASFHGNEWITTPILIQFLNDYLLALTNGLTIKGVQALSIYMNAMLHAIPMVNPDGVNLVLNGPPTEREEEVIRLNRGSRDFSGWKANIEGVDLNKQFPAKWEFETERKPKEPGPRDFPGYSPISEPESKAMAALVENEDYDRLIAVHTQGREFYWGYEGLEPPESEILARDFAQVSGYQSVRYVDSFAGYKDWFIKEKRKPGFTLELGHGKNPLPLTQYDEIYSHVLGIFVRSLI